MIQIVGVIESRLKIRRRATVPLRGAENHNGIDRSSFIHSCLVQDCKDKERKRDDDEEESDRDHNDDQSNDSPECD